MRRLRIAYVPSSLRPGGAERQMMALAERLPRDRFQVDFMSVIGQGSYDERVEAAGSQVHLIGSMPVATDGLIRKGLKRSGKILAYIQASRAARYDVVDAWLYPLDIMAAFARPLTRTPVVIAGRRNVDPRTKFGYLEGAIGSLANRMTDAVVANSTAGADLAVKAQGVDPAKIHVIRNGVLLPAPAPATERARVRHELGASDGEVLIGCIANYRDVKGIDRVIDAVAGLVRDGLPLRLELVGDGDLRADLKRQIDTLGMAERICLHGAVLDVEPLYPAFDVVVQGSLREGMPNGLLEAGAAGRAIVATAAGGTSEIVIDGQTGLLVPVDDSRALAEAIRRVATDEGLRGRLGGAARDHIETAFGMDRFVAEFAELYESMIASKRSAT